MAGFGDSKQMKTMTGGAMTAGGGGTNPTGGNGPTGSSRSYPKGGSKPGDTQSAPFNPQKVAATDNYVGGV